MTAQQKTGLRQHASTRAMSLFVLAVFAMFTVLQPCSETWAAALPGTPATAAAADSQGVETTRLQVYDEEACCHRLQDTSAARHQATATPPGRHVDTPPPALAPSGPTGYLAVTPLKIAAASDVIPSSIPLYLRTARLLI